MGVAASSNPGYKTYFPSNFNVEQIFRSIKTGLDNPIHEACNLFKKNVTIDGKTFDVYTVFYGASATSGVVLNRLATAYGKL